MSADGTWGAALGEAFAAASPARQRGLMEIGGAGADAHAKALALADSAQTAPADAAADIMAILEAVAQSFVAEVRVASPCVVMEPAAGS